MGFVIWSPSGRLPRCARNDIKYFVRNKIHSLKSQNFDAIKPHKYKSILWGPRDVSFGVLKILVYRRTTSLLKSHYRSDNAHSFACVRLFPRVVCFSFDQPIVASDSRLSYACILLFPTGTQYPVGAHYTVSRGVPFSHDFSGSRKNSKGRKILPFFVEKRG